ncbi:type VI secretion system protein TssA [Paraburkholderia jirisanensis]
MPTNYITLLEPVNGASPCGDDMLFSAEFDAIQHARRFDDASLDQGEWVTDIKEADWPFVAEQCSALLQTQTKDLRLAVWLAEALAIEEGATGLTQGYALLAGLCERYWDHVHPLADGDDVEYRVGHIGWLLGRSAELLRALPLTQAPDSAYSTLDWDVATHVAQAVKRDPENADEITRGKPSIEQIEASKRATPTSFYVVLLADLRSFEAAMLSLEQELDRRAGDAAPSFRQAKDAYQAVYRLAERFAKDIGANLGTAAAAKAQQEAPERPERAEPSFITPSQEEYHVHSPTTPAPVGASGVIQTRAQAVAQLRAVARFFRHTEPHSPAAYLADKAAEWADMPLHQWLATVVKDDGSLAHIREMLGVKPDDKA